MPNQKEDTERNKQAQTTNDTDASWSVQLVEASETSVVDQHTKDATSETTRTNIKVPFYIPLTDVPYPDEVDSTFDLKRFLKGDYCLESDLPPVTSKKQVDSAKPLGKSHLTTEQLTADIGSMSSSDSYDSEEGREVMLYFRNQLEEVSFAGGIIHGIAKNYKASHAICAEERKRSSYEFPRRRSTFSSVGSTDSRSLAFKKKEVRIAPSVDLSRSTSGHVTRRQTGVVRDYHDDSNTSTHGLQRQSTLTKLYDVGDYDLEGPKLKEYVPLRETTTKNTFLTRSTLRRVDEDSNEHFLRRPETVERDSDEQLQTLSLQHGRKLSRKISSDYVKTMDTGNKQDVSIRSYEFAKFRPSLTISQYRMKTAEYKNNVLAVNEQDITTSSYTTSTESSY